MVYSLPVLLDTFDESFVATCAKNYSPSKDCSCSTLVEMFVGFFKSSTPPKWNNDLFGVHTKK